MKTTKIVIKNLFGIKETELDGRSVELSGPKGSGKTSVLDSIRYALTNRSDRDYIVHRGADEGEIIIETDTGLSIDRKALPAKSAGTVKVRDGSLLQTRPAEFLSQIFTPLQLNPVEFTQLSRQEKNRVILNLIEFAWDTNWIREQFGEIPQGVDYSKHILEVLHDIQAENGVYFQSRQNINRDIRNKQAFVSDIAKDIPSGYDFDHWNTYPIGEKYRELEGLKEQNNVIERARAFRNSHEAKLRGLEGQRDLDIAAIDRKTSEDRTRLTADIERLKAEIRLYEERLAGLDERREESVRVVISSFNEKKAKLERDAGIADQYIGRELADTTALSKEIDTAEATAGEIPCIVNCMVFTEGTDIPRVETVIIARPTQSETLYAQMVGRGLRLYPGKQQLELIDCVGITGKTSLCTAPSLLGIDMANVPKRKETDIEGDLFELPEKIAAASDSPESWVKNIHLVDLWAQEQKYQTHDVNWFKMPDGSLVCSLSNRQRITIPCPDALGMVNLASGARCGMQEALDLAYLTLIRDHPNDRMLWDLQAVRKWGKSPATAKQLEIIKKRCKGFDTANLSKGDASQILNRLLNEPKKRRGA